MDTKYHNTPPGWLQRCFIEIYIFISIEIYTAKHIHHEDQSEIQMYYMYIIMYLRTIHRTHEVPRLDCDTALTCWLKACHWKQVSNWRGSPLMWMADLDICCWYMNLLLSWGFNAMWGHVNGAKYFPFSRDTDSPLCSPNDRQAACPSDCPRKPLKRHFRGWILHNFFTIYVMLIFGRCGPRYLHNLIIWLDSNI